MNSETAPTYQFQAREIGETDWAPCDHGWYLYCQKSTEHDTRVVEIAAQQAAVPVGICDSMMLSGEVCKLPAGHDGPCGYYAAAPQQICLSDRADYETQTDLNVADEIQTAPAAPQQGKPDINAMVNRFLAWPLPADVCADPCATMPCLPNRYGTNLLTASQAKAMFEHVLAGQAAPQPQVVETSHDAAHRAMWQTNCPNNRFGGPMKPTETGWECASCSARLNADRSAQGGE